MCYDKISQSELTHILLHDKIQIINKPDTGGKLSVIVKHLNINIYIHRNVL